MIELHNCSHAKTGVVMKKLEHEDVVLFTTKEQLDEYISLSCDTDFLEHEVNQSFPQIQSKHWSFHLKDHDPSLWDIKKKALTRLVSYEHYKSICDCGEDWQKPKQPTLVQKPFDVKIALDIENELINGFVMTKNGGLANLIRPYEDGLVYCVKFPRKGSGFFEHYCNSLGQCYPLASGNDDYNLIIFVWC